MVNEVKQKIDRLPLVRGTACLPVLIHVSGDSVGRFNVLYGAGMTYDIIPNLVADASWTRYTGHGKLGNSYQPDADLFALGITYKFSIDLASKFG